jgi:hypothetical protein
MNKKVNFIWELQGGSWRWVATHYQGNGIFFGQVFSPFTPEGEYGTWYYWEIKQNGAVLVRGSQQELDKLLSTKQTQKAMQYQKAVMEKRTQMTPHLGGGI